MGIRLPWRRRVLIHEVTARCNLDCLHCYNVWKGRAPYPSGELEPAEAAALLARVVRESRAGNVGFTGGEPLLRDDLEDLVAAARREGASATLITNGTLLDAARARSLLDAGVSLFEIAVNSPRRELHDALARRPAFDRAVDAISFVRAAGGRVVLAVVVSRRNVAEIEELMTLAAGMGVDAVMLNRFNPGGEGMRHLVDLLPSGEDLAAAFAAAERVARRFSLPVASSVPVPRELLRTRPYRRIRFGACPLGTWRAYYTIDPLGNLRSCNHSPRILGSLRDRSFAELATVERPPDAARGHCPAAAEACGGKDPSLLR
jgi:pyrroloquinoline quinone biosynthesis protein E